MIWDHLEQPGDINPPVEQRFGPEYAQQVLEVVEDQPDRESRECNIEEPSSPGFIPQEEEEEEGPGDLKSNDPDPQVKPDDPA